MKILRRKENVANGKSTKVRAGWIGFLYKLYLFLRVLALSERLDKYIFDHQHKSIERFLIHGVYASRGVFFTSFKHILKEYRGNIPF